MDPMGHGQLLSFPREESGQNKVGGIMGQQGQQEGQ